MLPGLIDAHVHVAAAEGDLAALPGLSPSYAALHAARALETMLYRGFTTVRDCGGADFGIAQAQHAGLLTGSQLRFGGKALSQTGGHGDVRHRGDDSPDPGYCCPGFGRVATASASAGPRLVTSSARGRPPEDSHQRRRHLTH